MQIVVGESPQIVFLLVDAQTSQPATDESPTAHYSRGTADWIAIEAVENIGRGWYSCTLPSEATTGAGPLIIVASGDETEEWRDMHQVVAATTQSDEALGSSTEKETDSSTDEESESSSEFESDSILTAKWRTPKSETNNRLENATTDGFTYLLIQESDNQQVYQYGMQIRAGQKYRLQFSTSGTGIASVHLHDHNIPSQQLGMTAFTVQLESSIEPVEFTAPIDCDNGRLRFMFSIEAGERVFVENCRLVEVTSAESA